MHYEWLDAYLLSFPGVEKDYQPVWQWFRYKVRGRLFAAVCSPGPEYKIYGGHDLVNLKCGAAEGELLRARYPDILPGFYSDKRTWISCLLDGELPEEVLRDLCGRSYALAVEKLYFKNNQKTAIDVAQARGVILLAARQAGVPLYEYTPLQVKSAVTGYGKAEKPQVMEMTRRLRGLRAVPRPDDTADALAIAICHGQTGGTALKRSLMK